MTPDKSSDDMVNQKILELQEQLVQSRKEARQALRDKRLFKKKVDDFISDSKKISNMFQNIIETMEDGIMIEDENGFVKFANDAMISLLGYSSQDEVYKRPWAEFFSLEQEKEIEGRKGAFESLLLTQDGAKIPILITSSSFYFEGEYIGVLSVIKDITQRKRSEERISKMNSCFLDFGSDPSENIDRLTELCGDLLNADCAYYFRIEGPLYWSVGRWRIPADIPIVSHAQGHLVQTIFHEKSDAPTIYADLANSPIADTDPFVCNHGHTMCIGIAVKHSYEHTGALCLMYKNHYAPDEQQLDLVGILAAAIGIEENRHKIEESLQDKIQIENLMALITNKFINIRSEHTDRDINLVLQMISMFMGMDRGKIYQIAENDSKFYLTYEWCGKEIAPTQGGATSILDAPWCREQFRYSMCIHYDDIVEMPPGEEMSDVFFQNKGIQSFAAVPMMSSDKMVGLICFEAIHNKKKWQESTIKMLIDFSRALNDAFERVRSEELLRAARREAEAASVAKSSFLANMSHEIRTPLNGILGMGELLQTTHLDDQQSEFADILQKSAQTLLHIIGDILDFSKIEAGQFSLISKPFNLESVIADVIGILAPKFMEKGLDLLVDYPSHIPVRFLGDSLRIRQILMNLVGNSVKFTEKGCVWVQVRIESELKDDIILSITVSDTGVGIPAHNLTSIFEEFSQADETNVRKFEGTGLGLAITKKLVEMMHGRIKVESTPGQGSNFHFTIHLGKLPDAKRMSSQSVALDGLKVLIVDHYEIRTKIMQNILKPLNVHCHSVQSGEEACDCLAHARSQGAPYDMAVINFSLIRGGGIQVATDIRKDPDNADLGLVLMLSMGKHLKAQEIHDAGFASQLKKPFTTSQMIEALAKAQAVSHGGAGMAAAGDASPDEDGESLDLKFHILLVEDNEVNRLVGMRFLEDIGCTCDIAEDGARAIAMATANAYDLILMDCQMPTMDGFESTRHIRKKNGVSSAAPIVAMTALALDGDRERCLSAGMDDYLPKPISLDGLRTIILKHCSLAETDQGPGPDKTPDAAPASDNMVFDKTKIIDLSAGDAVFIQEIIEIFLKDTPELLNGLKQALDANDRKGAERKAHSLKGSSALMGAGRLEAVAREMEMQAGLDELQRVQELLPQAENEFDILKTRLNEL